MSTQLVRIDTELKKALDEKRGPLSISKYLQFVLLRGEVVNVNTLDVEPNFFSLLRGVN